jgi:tetratricopeptide (TPR) repeat protein
MNIRTYIDDDLRIRPTSTKKLAAALQRERETLVAMRAEVKREPNSLNASHLGRTLGRLSEHLWLDGQTEDALALGEEALDIWEELERDKAAFLQRLKLADYRAHVGDETDLEALEAMVDEADGGGLAVYRDFALEALARRSYEAGDYDRALESIEAALDLRRERGNEKQVEQTEKMRRIIVAARENPASES